MARPKRAEASSKPITVRLSPSELLRACQAAQVNRQLVGAFIRDAIVTDAEECLEGDAGSSPPAA